jgi:hypothetical protein
MNIVDLKFVSYDGKYPNLCSGALKFVAVYDDGTEKEFLWEKFLISTGGRRKNKTFKGEWEVDFPMPCYRKKYLETGFTPMVMSYLEKLVNENVEHGCCGGCS